jgi:5-formyltetrahydrofolate cyclo-ligase
LPPLDPEARAWRKAERARLIAARHAMSPEARAEASAAIEGSLRTRLAPGGMALVAGYWPIQGEFDPLPCLRAIIAAGAAVALPAIVAPDAPLEFRPWTPEAPMAAGPGRTRHPLHGPAVAPEMVLVPLVGFDTAGYRLGFGGGYYDRTLPLLAPRPLVVGIGFEIGRLASVRPQAHDVRMDLIVTEAGVFATTAV